MKVVLKETVYDRIRDRLSKAERDNRKVDYILVSEAEYRELRDDRRTYRALSHQFARALPGDEARRNATFRTWEFRLRSGWRRNSEAHRDAHEFIRVASFDEFMGYPLVAVPDAYMPD